MITNRQAEDIRRKLIAGKSCAALAREYGCSHQCIAQIRDNTTHRGHGPDASHMTRQNRIFRRIAKIRRLAVDHSPAEVSEMLGIPLVTLRADSRNYGIRFGKRSKFYHVATPIRRDAAKALRQAGYKAEEIAAVLNVSRITVYRMTSEDNDA